MPDLGFLDGSEFETGCNYEGDQGLIDFDFLESRHLRIGQTPTLIEHLGPVYYDNVPSKFDGEGE